MALVVARKKVHGSLACPELEGIGLVLALVMRPLDLEHGVARRNHVRDELACERLLELEIPLLRALLDEPWDALLPVSV
jgi:hypothetical protein